MNWPSPRDDSWTNPGAMNSISIDAQTIALDRIKEKTGLSILEIATAFIPVLAVEQGIDIHLTDPVGMRARVFKRSDLAARFHCDINRPIGLQLARDGIISRADAELIDGNMFYNRKIAISIRIDKSAVPNLQSELKSLLDLKLVAAVTTQYETDAYWFIELITDRFVELSRRLTIDLNNAAVLLTLNGSVLYF